MQPNKQDSLILDDQSTVSIPNHGMPNSPPPSEHAPTWSINKNILTYITENKLWNYFKPKKLDSYESLNLKLRIDNSMHNSKKAQQFFLEKPTLAKKPTKTKLPKIDLVSTPSLKDKMLVSLNANVLSPFNDKVTIPLKNTLSNNIFTPINDNVVLPLKNTFSQPAPSKISKDKPILYTSNSDNIIPKHTEYDSGDLTGLVFTDDFYEKTNQKHVPSSSLETVNLNSIDLDRINEDIPSNLNTKEDTYKTNAKESQVSYLQSSLIGFKSADLVIDIHDWCKNPTYDNVYNIVSDLTIIPTILTGFTKTSIGLNSLLSLYLWYNTGFKSILYNAGYSLLYMSVPKVLSTISGSLGITAVPKILVPFLTPIGYAYTGIMIGSAAYYTMYKAYFSYCTHYAKDEGICKANFYRPWLNSFKLISETTGINYFGTKTQEYRDLIESLETIQKKYDASDSSNVDTNTCLNEHFTNTDILGETSNMCFIGDIHS